MRQRQPRDRLAQHWPLFVALFVFVLLLLGTLRAYLPQTGGRFIYALDDAYIQMAIAKNLAVHGLWGVTPYAFSGAGSSLLWPLILAGVERVFGRHEISALVLNVAGAAALLAAVYAIAKRYVPSRWAQLGVPVLVTIGAPLSVLAVIGMEHTLQSAIALSVAFAGVRAFRAADVRERHQWSAWLLIGALLATAIRYETAAVLVGLAVVGLASGAWRIVIALCGAGAIPPLTYAFIAWRHDWPPLPSSVLIKAQLSEGALHQIRESPVLGALLVLGLVQLAKHVWSPRSRPWREPEALVAVFVVAALIHVQFGLTGIATLYRYEAYLVVLGIVANAAALAEHLRAAKPLRSSVFNTRTALTAILVCVLLYQCDIDTREAVDTAAWVYRSSYQVGLFLRHHPQPGTPMLSAIGPTTYLNDVQILDLDGLANIDVTRSIRAGTFDVTAVARAARLHDGRMAAVQTLGTPIPTAWLCVAQWRDVVDQGTTFFYALDPRDATALAADLAAFDSALPDRVTRIPRRCERNDTP
jgi:hypothetical protein